MHLPRRSRAHHRDRALPGRDARSDRTRAEPRSVTNPVADGFQPRAVAFFDAGHGIIAGSIVCPTCAKHRTAAVSTTADGGHTWGTPVTFHARRRERGHGGARRHGCVGAGGHEDPAQWRRRDDVVAASRHRRDRRELRHRDARLGDPSDERVTDNRGVGGRRQRVERGSHAVPAGCGDPVFVTRTTTEHGWAVCGGDAAAGSLRQVVWKTVDGGATWTRGFHGVAPGPAGYRFLDDGHGWRWHYVFADIFRSTDGGTTWNDLGSAGNVVVVDLWFVSDTHGFAVMQLPNGASRLRSSADGGTTWSGVATSPGELSRLSPSEPTSNPGPGTPSPTASGGRSGSSRRPGRRSSSTFSETRARCRPNHAPRQKWGPIANARCAPSLRCDVEPVGVGEPPRVAVRRGEHRADQGARLAASRRRARWSRVVWRVDVPTGPAQRSVSSTAAFTSDRSARTSLQLRRGA